MTDEPEDDKKTTAQKALVVGYTLIAWPSKKGEETYKCHGTPASIKKLAGEDDEFEQSGFKFTAYCAGSSMIYASVATLAGAIAASAF